jgi:hypothetical protein
MLLADEINRKNIDVDLPQVERTSLENLALSEPSVHRVFAGNMALKNHGQK